MSKWRYTIETLQAGQPRAYADTTYHYRMTIEWQGMAGYKDKNAPFIPADKLGDDSAKRYAKMHGPWIEKDDPDCNWASTQLEFFRKVGPNVWEWKTRAAFTD